MAEREVVWSGSMPETYDAHLGPALFTPAADALAQRVAGNGATDVLELAAGTGIVTSAVTLALPDARVVATDLNPAMVAYGAQQVPAATWQQADALDLPFESASFDLLICQFGVMFLPDRVKGFREALRVLRPGGSYVFATWDVVEENDFVVALVEALVEVGGGEGAAFLRRVPYGYADPEAIRRDVEAGGLAVDAIDVVPLSGRSTALDVATGFCQGTPTRAFLGELGDIADVTERVAAGISARMGDTFATRPQAVFVTARTRG